MMPRPKAHPRHGTQAYPVRPVRLSEADKRLLCNYAGLRLEHAHKGEAPTPADRMLADVRSVLELWPGLEVALDQAPTPKDCAAALRPVEKHAAALRLALDALDARSRRLLEQPPTRISDRKPEDPYFAQRFDLDGFQGYLFLMWARARVAVRELQSQAEPGTPQSRALMFVVDQVADVFDQFNAKDDCLARSDFVGAALEAGRISVEDFDVFGYLERDTKAR
jgi:hypothetical protein